MKHTLPPVRLQFQCPMNFESMERVDGGRFCTTCASVVRDFSAMSNEELIRFLEQRGPEKICGTFRPEQVDQHAGRAFTWKRFRLLAAATFAGAWIIPQQAKAQITFSAATDSTGKAGWVLKGTIKDRLHNRPQENATIELLNHDGENLADTETDSTGKFELFVYDLNPKDTFGLNVSAWHFETYQHENWVPSAEQEINFSLHWLPRDHRPRFLRRPMNAVRHFLGLKPRRFYHPHFTGGSF